MSKKLRKFRWRWLGYFFFCFISSYSRHQFLWHKSIWSHRTKWMENRNGFGKSVCNAQLIRKFNMKVAIATPSIRRNLFSCFLWQSCTSSYYECVCVCWLVPFSVFRSMCVSCPHWCDTKRACVQNTLHISFCTVGYELAQHCRSSRSSIYIHFAQTIHLCTTVDLFNHSPHFLSYSRWKS